MNIAVAVRLMPNVGDEIEVDPSGTDIDRELVEMVINEFDDQALEEAVLIKEATGATVTAVGVRSEGMEQALRVAFARGADRVVVVEAGAIDPYDSRTAAFALSAAFSELAPDLVLIGVQTPYDVFGQTAPYVAVALGWPHANVVVGVTLVDGAARVVQEYAGGRLAVLSLGLPAVVGVQSASSPPRYVSMSRLREAMTQATAETLEVSVSAPAGTPKLVSLARPEPQIGATMLEGDAEAVAAQLAEVLQEREAGELMGDVLVYVEHPVNDGLLAFARSLADQAGGALVMLPASGEPAGADRLAVADVVLEVSHPALSPYLPEAHQAVLVAAIRARAPDLVLLENTTAGLDLGAAAAAAADLPFVGYCDGLSLQGAEVESISGIFGGQLKATVRTSLPAVFAINSAALHEQSHEVGRGERIQLPPPAELDSLRTKFVEAVEPSDEGVDLTKADRIVCVGRGIGGAENIPIAEELAAALGAELAASRPVIDSGWLPKARQVGKSGASVKPKLYLALGVSGAPEHVEGMQGAELIVAVNTDPGAAIFNIAHYGVVGDLFDVADELTSLLGD